MPAALLPLYLCVTSHQTCLCSVDRPVYSQQAEDVAVRQSDHPAAVATGGTKMRMKRRNDVTKREGEHYILYTN